MSKSPYKHIAILGPGLLGGSLGMAVRTLLPDVRVSAWARRSDALSEILSLGAADAASCNMKEVVEEADLIVLATPVGAMPLLAEAYLPYLKKGVVVTDVGSVKKVVHEKTGTLLTREGITFIGSHPMAGSEKQGLSAARKDLFKAAPIVLTNNENAAEEAVQALSDFWASLGCLCYRMEASDHDRKIAQISHLTHLLSSLATQVGLTKGEEGALGLVSGAGFRDTTRVSSGNPVMWSEILVENREALLPLLEKAIGELSRMKEFLKGEGDTAQVKSWLEEARNKRERAMESCALGSTDDSTV